MYKKFVFSLIIAIVLGSLLGNFLFKQYQEEDRTVFYDREQVYFFQEGSYDNLERATKATENLDTKIIVKEDAKYYVYLAITQDIHNKEKLEKMYKDMGINVTVKKMNVSNSSFITCLEQMDGLMEKTKEKEEILPINRVILANYEELVLNS